MLVEKQYVLSINLATLFSLTNEGLIFDRLLNVDKLQLVIDNILGHKTFWDAAVPKSVSEFLVYGSTYSPTPVQSLEVGVKVGDIHKEITAFGDRTWNESGISEPIPFKVMPINYNNSFGGVDYKPNPLGKGYKAVVGSSLPNIESPSKFVTDIADTTEPAGFEPYPPSSQQRGFELNDPKDLIILETDNTPKYFNTAPNDQRLSGYYKGDEVIEITNMHQFMPKIKSSLPLLRLRLFALQKNAKGDNTFRELNVINDTLWLLPNLEYGALIYKSTLLVADETASDVSCIYTAIESQADTPKSFEYYSSQFQEIILSYAKTTHASGDITSESKSSDNITNTDVKFDEYELEEDGITEFFRQTSSQEDLDALGLNDSAKSIINQLSSVLKQFQINEDSAKELIKSRKEKGLPPSLTEDEIVGALEEGWGENPEMEAKVRQSLRDLNQIKLQMIEKLKQLHQK